MRPLRVWIAANTTWYVFNFRGRLITELTSQGYAVTALSPSDEYVERVRALGAQHVHLEMDNAGTNPFRDFALIRRLIRLFKRAQPDLVLTFTPKVNIYCSLAAKQAGVPVIANISGLGSGFIRGGWLARLIKVLYRTAMRHPSRVFFQNPDDRALFLSSRLVAESIAECLPGSGVDVERFVPRPVPARGARFIFLMVARLLKDKGVYEYVRAAEALRTRGHDAEFHLVGSLEAKNPTAVRVEEVRRWEHDGIVRVFGPTDDIERHYAGADCVVLPSYREGCPRTLLEAASMGKPVIATDVTGCRQVVEDGVTGFLVRLADAEDLVRKMEKMLSIGADERAQMGACGRQKMLREFDERLVLRRYLDATAAALSAGPVPVPRPAAR